MQPAVAASSQAEQITRVIFEYAAKISREQDLSNLIRLNADLARDLVGAARCSLWLIDESSGELVTRVADGMEEIRIPAGTGVVGSCVAMNKAVLVNDAASDKRFFRNVDDNSGFVTESILTVPLSADGKVIGALQLLNKPGGFAENDADLMTFSASYSASAIHAERLRQQAEMARLLTHELNLARDVQRSLFPRDLRQVAGIEYSGFCRQAKSVGGDYYDFQTLPGDLFSMSLGDVSGKGLPAAVLMASIQTLLRSLLSRDPLPVAEVMNELNKSVFYCAAAERYSTLFCGVLDAARRKLTYVNAGHVHPILVRAAAGGKIERPSDGGLPIGVLPVVRYTDATVDVEPGDLIVCISDGVSEATNPGDEMWGERAAAAVVAEYRDGSVEKVVGSLVRAADEFAAGAKQFDDMTVIAVRIQS